VRVVSEEASRLLGNVTVKEIINCLKSGEKTVNDVVDHLNKISPTGLQPLAVELYLWLLAQKGYVEVKGSGPTAVYSLTDKGKMLQTS
jgi:DNA-binding HxlR family transcriptional regulator